jgi:molybdenum cofactor cytidylyltransferase
MQLARALRLGAQDVVALAGGGGKTTLMFRLAAELVAAGGHVVTTMTTRIFLSQMKQAPAHLIVHSRMPGTGNTRSGPEEWDDGAWLDQLTALLAAHGHVLVASDTDVEAGKVAGVPVALVDRLARMPGVDAVILEADGSRRLPFKAPAGHEPVIPGSATIVVPMVGMDALGRPLDATAVHRPERVAALTGAAPGAPITPAIIAQVLVHPQGGARGLPPGARLVPFLNKVEDEETLEAAREVARLALAEARVESVVIGALHQPDPAREVWTRAGAVVLAAGSASRYGALKQALPWRGRPLVAHVAAQALACVDVRRVAVTLGAGAAEVQAALAGLPIEPVPVPNWADGQSQSVRAGLSALTRDKGPLGAVLFLLADQPGVSPALLSALIDRHRATLAPVVAPRFNGQRGNPVLFDRGVFDEFEALRGDVGARPIIEAYANQIAWLDWPTPEITQDIDRPADYLPPP